MLTGLENDMETHLLESDYFVYSDNIVLAVLSRSFYFHFVGTSNSPLGKVLSFYIQRFVYLETQDVCAFPDNKLSQLFLEYLEILIFNLPM